ncbi:MAG: hypothetical protein K2M98_06980 [Muribaculum sp.]|nr:hypothetical protein [Muribaculum sp.]
MKKIIKYITSFIFATIATGASAASHTAVPDTLDYNSLNSRASAEYLQPIRPGYEGRNPFWNEFAIKFTFAPAFDFMPVDNAVVYRYTIVCDTAGREPAPGDRPVLASPRFEPVSFTTDVPHASLQSVWDSIPPSRVILTVEALDGKGNVMKEVAQRKFLRDFGFKGPYHSAVRPYREAALKGMLFIHNLPPVQSWLTSQVPDMTYPYYAYANKIISAIVRNEVLVSRYMPSERDKALAIARNAADFLISNSLSDSAPLAAFPPTYYTETMAGSLAENSDATMTMDANYATQAFLDLFDATGDSTYYNQAVKITRTYLKLQRPDGSFPIKISYITGEPLSDTGAMLHSICMVADRMRSQYGVTEFEDMRQRAERWMHDVAIQSFDMNAQFEDVSVMGLKPYENLTNYVAANYVRYLMAKEQPTQADIDDARDLMRLCEDQFVHWDYLPNVYGYHRYNTPCVMEQFRFREPVDNSASNVAGGFLALYKVCGDPLDYAKAKALIDNMTIQQNQQTGYLPTYWEYRNQRVNEMDMWANCALTTIERLLEFDQMHR